MKRRSVLFGFLLSSLLPISITALPQLSKVVSGDVAVLDSDPNVMVIRAGDLSIIDYQSFNISQSEKVQFLQPSSSSVVLNRIIGDSSSEILGKMQSNGKVFLVNPHGVYFGRDAEVNVGSLIVSSLDLSDADFLNQRFAFCVKEEKEFSQVINLGNLTANEDVVILAPSIHNEGVIVARGGKVLLAAGEKVILDFEGTGLMHFAVEGQLQQSMIEQAGSLEALQGEIHLSMSSIGNFIKQVINADHIAIANELIEEKGVIRLVKGSKTQARGIEVVAREGSHVEVEGLLDVSSDEEVGGTVHFFGETFTLGEAEILASGKLGGGEVLIGGDLQGGDSYFRAKNVNVTPSASIVSDALVQGDGGKVVIWSDERTLFNGFISSKGGELQGDGGLVETSGWMGLTVQTGRVDTSAPLGKMGTWLLDPLHIEVVEARDGIGSTLADVALCSDTLTSSTIFSSTIQAASTNTNIALCAPSEGGTITITDAIFMENFGTSLTLTVNSNSGSIFLNNNITTLSGSVAFEGPVFVGGGGTVSLNTTGMGAGKVISFSESVDSGSSSTSLSVTSGVGEISFLGPVGQSNPLASLTTLSTGNVNLASDIITRGSSIGVVISSPLVLVADAKIDTTGSGTGLGAAISLNNGVNGSYKLLLNAGDIRTGAAVSVAASGQDMPLAMIQIKGSSITLNGDVTASGGTMIFIGQLYFAGPVSLLDTGPTGLIFEGPVDCVGGSYSVNLTAPMGRVSFLSSVGQVLPPENLTVSADLIQLGDDVTVNTSLTLNNAVQLLGDLQISALNMTFVDTVDGSYDLSLNAGASGTIAMNNIVGSSARLGSFVVENTNTLLTQGIYAENIHQMAASGLCIYNEFLDTTGNGGVNLVGAGDFQFNGGIQTLNGGAFTINAGGSITATSETDMILSNQFMQLGSGAVNWQGSMLTRNGNIVFTGPLNLLGPVLLNTEEAGEGNIIFNSSVDGPYSLSLAAGFGSLTFSGLVGGVSPLGDVLLVSARNVLANQDIQASSYTQLTGYGTAVYAGNLIMTGDLGINISSNYVSFAGTNAGKILSTTNGNIAINAEFGDVNSNTNPIQVSVMNGLGSLFVGSAGIAYFSSAAGQIKSLCSIRPNNPCAVDHNNQPYTLSKCCQHL